MKELRFVRSYVAAAGLVCLLAADAQAVEAVRASSFGWRADDATECLQKAIDSGAKKIVIDRQAGDWIVRPLSIMGKSDFELVLADGVTLRAKKGEFHSRGDCLFRIDACTNIVFRGEGKAQCVMNKQDYRDPSKYCWSEWRHLVSIGSQGTCYDVTLRNLELRCSGGDGVYVCHRSRDVRLYDVRCYDNHRQGISLISCERFLAKNCIFNTTTGTSPMDGVDLEPNNPGDRLNDVLFEDCVFEGNDAAGVEVCVALMNATTPPISCTFRRCVARNNKRAAFFIYPYDGKWVEQGVGPVRGTVLFEDCKGIGNRGGAMLFREAVPNGIRTIFRNCEFDVTGAKDAVTVNGNLPFDFGGLTCENVRIVTDGKPEITFAPFYGAGAIDCHGAITFVNAKDGKETVVDLEKWAAEHPSHPECLAFKTIPVDYERLAPATEGLLKEPVSTDFIDQSFTFVQCLPKAGEYEIEIDVAKRQPNAEPNPSYRLADMRGTDLGTFPLKMGRNKILLKSHGRNVYRLYIALGKGKARVQSRHPGCGVEAVAPVQTFGLHKRRYFLVPAAATEVRVKAEMQGANVGVLYDASGRRVAERKKGEGGNRIFFATRTPTTKDELWSVGFDSNIWLNGYQIGAPALPIAFASPESAMVYTR